MSEKAELEFLLQQTRAVADLAGKSEAARLARKARYTRASSSFSSPALQKWVVRRGGGSRSGTKHRILGCGQGLVLEGLVGWASPADCRPPPRFCETSTAAPTHSEAQALLDTRPPPPTSAGVDGLVGRVLAIGRKASPTTLWNFALPMVFEPARRPAVQIPGLRWVSL